MSKSTVEYRWEAYDVDTGKVEKRGPIRDDLAKVTKYKTEIEVGISNLNDGGIHGGPHLAPYWANLKLRTLTRTISPWTEMESQEA